MFANVIKNIEQLNLSGILMKYDIGSRKKVKVNELSDTKFSLWVVFKNLGF